MSDRIITRAEEVRLRKLRDRLPLDSVVADPKAASQLSRARASTDRLMLDAKLAALAVDDAESHLNELSSAITQAGLNPHEATALLTRAWEAAVQSTLEDGLLTLDDESALNQYIDHFRLNHEHLDRNGVLTQVVKSAVLRDIAEGVVPDRYWLA